MRSAHGADVSLFSLQMHGKWFDIAIGTTCKWMKNYKEKFSMGTLVLGPGPSADQISTTSTRLRYGRCWEQCWRCLSLLQSHQRGCSLSQGLGQTDMGVTCSAWHPNPEEGMDWVQIPNTLGRTISGVLRHVLGAPDMIFMP